KELYVLGILMFYLLNTLLVLESFYTNPVQLFMCFLVIVSLASALHTSELAAVTNYCDCFRFYYVICLNMIAYALCIRKDEYMVGVSYMLAFNFFSLCFNAE
ncbi:hypothetical protein L9F63_003650, partial [Diploptera punctata]